jgi:transmembrane sensor
MEKNNYNSADLLFKYKQGTCSEEELAIVESWHIKELYNNDFIPEEAELIRAKKAIWDALPIHDQRKNKSVHPLWMKYAAAASFIFMLSAGLYFYATKKEKANIQLTQAERFKNDVDPGSNKAVLILADGRKVTLDNAQSGLLAQQGEADIQKTADGQIIYNQNDQLKKEVLINRLVTPRGGQHKIVLSDGTRVWLNSASMLSYPTTFSGNSREVKLSGEAYFEVAHNPKLPFKVVSDKQVIQVLGTHFNVNCYPTETAVKTTLLEGSVKIIHETNDFLLKPGQQAVVANRVQIQKADLDQAMAWMNGDFNFKDDNIRSIMRKLERWYDIEVIYDGTVSDIDYGAEISRTKSLAQVLNYLEKTGNVHFKIEGRRVTVMQ